MPLFNKAQFVRDAVSSVQSQTYPNWELVIVDDGSTDSSWTIVNALDDPRIVVIRQPNKGVSAARNTALQLMKGSFFCFLDADDILTPNSIEVRLNLFKTKPDTDFVDGVVEVYDPSMMNRLRTFKPSCTGNPFRHLVRLEASCFFGPSWLVRKKEGYPYRFDETITHGEDLLFYLDISRTGGHYDYVEETILNYRKGMQAAMSDLDGLAMGYDYISRQIAAWTNVSPTDRLVNKFRKRKIMFLSYLHSQSYRKAFQSLLK